MESTSSMTTSGNACGRRPGLSYITDEHARRRQPGVADKSRCVVADLDDGNTPKIFACDLTRAGEPLSIDWSTESLN